MKTIKTTILTILLLLAGATCHAQFTVGYSIGYGNYNFSDLKDGFESSIDGMYKITDNFDAYITHNVDLGYRFDVIEFGFKSSYVTTGAKASYEDYSGYLYTQASLRGFRQGLYLRLFLYDEKRFSCFFEISPALMFSEADLEAGGFIHAAPSVGYKEKESHSVTSFHVQPLIGAKYKLNDRFSLLVTGGYDFYVDTFNKEKAAFKPDWQGFRINAGISYQF